MTDPKQGCGGTAGFMICGCPQCRTYRAKTYPPLPAPNPMTAEEIKDAHASVVAAIVSDGYILGCDACMAGIRRAVSMEYRHLDNKVVCESCLAVYRKARAATDAAKVLERSDT